MWDLRRKKNLDCSRFQDGLAAKGPEVSALPEALQTHVAACAECRTAANNFNESRALLSALPSQRYEPSGWFVGRVMSAIAAREMELRRSVDTWSVISRLAAKLTWVSALALLLAGTWLYERPKATPHQTDSTAGESLFESPAPPAPDDVLASVAERD